MARFADGQDEGCLWKSWQVKQLESARYATCFWLRVIDDFTGSSFEQDVCDDAYWGRVVRQCFVSPRPDERD